MAEQHWEVTFQRIAKRDYQSQLLWLFENRGLRQANAFENKVDRLINDILAFPEFWPTLDYPRQHIRKALINSNTLLFYVLAEETHTIHVLAIRGAAEDWTNQNLLNTD